MVIVIGGTKHARENKVKSGSKNRCFCRMADCIYWTKIRQCLKFVQILLNFCPMLVKIELPFARGSKRTKEVMFLGPWPSVTYTVLVFDQKTHFSNHWGPARIYSCPDRWLILLTDVHGFTIRRALGCVKFLPGPAWLLFSETGPPFSASHADLSSLNIQGDTSGW